MKPHLRVIPGGVQRKSDVWHWRFIHLMEWVGDVHWIIYPLLLVAFVWYLEFGRR